MRISAEKLAALQNLWNSYRAIFANRSDTTRRLDIADLFAKWAERERLSLEKDGAVGSFDDLCRYKCAKLPLALVVAIIQPLQSSGGKWQKIVGTPRQREQKIKTLEKAANVLEDLLGSIADDLIADSDESKDTESKEAFRNELISPPENIFINSYAPDPTLVISALRTYASVLNMFELFQEVTTVTSPDMFAKYLISAYVYRTTGQFHDAEVSSLVGAAIGAFYDETAHRMWRSRNYQRIDKSLGPFADLLTAFGNASVS